MTFLRPLCLLSLALRNASGAQSCSRLRRRTNPALAAFAWSPFLTTTALGPHTGAWRWRPQPAAHRWRTAQRRGTATAMATTAEDEVEAPEPGDGPRLGFVGAGMMATAMVNGIVASKVTEPGNVFVSAPHRSSLDRLAKLGIRTSDINLEVASGSDVVVVAVKPDVVPAVLREIVPHLRKDALVVSIAAGIPLAVLEQLAPGKRVVRVMPNTPCLVSEGATGFSMGSLATDEDRDTVHALMGAVGLAVEVKEALLDGLTGVSGSGPAYIYVLIEALADGGVRMGLPRAMAIKLAAQTVKGAAEMVLETGEHPGGPDGIRDFWG
ncbi:unnamed protein product [Ectocarpus sp. 12 AP-2014]